MAAALPRYLFRRKDSANLYLRLQPPGRKVIEKSLRTTDVKLAEIRAADLINAHKEFMYARRPVLTEFWSPDYKLGLQVIDGRQVFADETKLRDAVTGEVIGPNGSPAELLTPPPLSGKPSFKAYDEAKRVAPTAKDGDDQLLENYLKHNGIAGYREKEARDMWHIFKTEVKKPIAKCAHEDGVAIVNHLVKQAGGEDKIKRATLRRRMVPLVATVNFAIKRGKLGELKINPFSGCVGKAHGANSRKRVRFAEDDMALMRANLDLLDENDRLLVRLLATTGLRRGEAFEIDSEQIEDGIRFCVVGTKTPQSRRRIPFPKDLLPHLPEKITGQLIPGRLDTASKRLRDWLTKIGITDPAKSPMHSFRHRAKRRLVNADVPGDLIDAIGGWANRTKKNSGDDYGTDEDNDVFSITKLKEAIDKIGF